MVKFNLKNTAMIVSFCMIIQPVLPFLPTAPADAAEIKAEKAPQVMPVLSEKAEKSAEAAVENHRVIDDLKKEGDDHKSPPGHIIYDKDGKPVAVTNGEKSGKPVGVIEPKPIEYLGPPTVEDEPEKKPEGWQGHPKPPIKIEPKEPPSGGPKPPIQVDPQLDPSDFGPAQPADDTDSIAKLPPSTDKIILPELEYSYSNKKGQEVSISSNDEGFTISFKNDPSVTTDDTESKTDRIPSIDSAMSYSYDKKTGKIYKTVCFEVCRDTELTLKGNKKEYLAALVSMKKAVDGAIKGLDGVALNQLKLKFKLKMLDNALRELIKQTIYYRPFPFPILKRNV